MSSKNYPVDNTNFVYPDHIYQYPQQRDLYLKRSKKDLQVESTIKFIFNSFFYCRNSYGSYFIVHKTSKQIYFMDDQNFLYTTKNIFFNLFGIDLQASVIKSAIANIKGCQTFITENNFLSRVAVSNDYFFLHFSDEMCLTIFGNQNVAFDDLSLTQDLYFFKSKNFKPYNLNPNFFIHDSPNVYQHHVSAPHIRNQIQKLNRKDSSLLALFEQLGLPESYGILIIAWMINSWLPSHNLVALEITGKPQSGKTTIQKAIRSLIDPAIQYFSDLPKNKKEFSSALLDGYLISFDNVSEIHPEIQEMLAKVLVGHVFDISTSSKQGERKFLLKRPVILNSINPVIDNAELSKFTITIDLKSLENVSVLCFEELEKKLFYFFNAAFHELICLTAAVFAKLSQNIEDNTFLKISPTAHLAHFCKIGTIVASELRYDTQDFWDQFDLQRKNRLAVIIEKNPIIEAILIWIEQEPDNNKTFPPHRWLKELEKFKPYLQTATHWPSNAHQMGAALRRAAPILREHGVSCEDLGKTGSYCQWQIKSNRVISPVEEQWEQDFKKEFSAFLSTRPGKN